MATERQIQPNTTSLETIDGIDFPTLAEAFVISEKFKKEYSRHTRQQYRERLRQANDLLLLQNTSDIDSATKAAIQKEEPTLLKPYVRVAVREAIRWANTQGLTDEILELPKKKLTKSQKRQNAYDRKTHAILEPDTLKNLIAEASLRDKAILATILATRAPQDIVRDLKTDSVRTSQNGRMLIVCEDKKIPVHPALSGYIKDYLETIAPGLLFRAEGKRGKKNMALSRQRFYQILDKYQEKLSIPGKISYGMVVDSGIAIFGFIDYPTPRNRNSSRTQKVPS
jgi:site-specific recombinase XerD